MLGMLKILKSVKTSVMPKFFFEKKEIIYLNDSNLLIKFRIFVCFVFKHFPRRNSSFGFLCSLKEQEKYKKIYEFNFVT